MKENAGRLLRQFTGSMQKVMKGRSLKRYEVLGIMRKLR